MLICVLWLLPYFHRRLVIEDWTIRWYHIFVGPFLLRRGPVPPVPEGVKVQIVQDFYRGHITKTDIQNGATIDEQYEAALAAIDVENGKPLKDGAKTEGNGDLITPQETTAAPLDQVDKPEPFYRTPQAFWMFLKRTVLRGLFVPVVEEQSRTDGSKLNRYLAQNIRDVHARAHKYDNKTEYLYSMLQAFTATTASFAHGYFAAEIHSDSQI